MNSWWMWRQEVEGKTFWYTSCRTEQLAWGADAQRYEFDVFNGGNGLPRISANYPEWRGVA